MENLFVTPLLRDLGYAEHQIRFKDAVEPAEVSIGRRTTRYHPDYLLLFDGKPRVVVDAKAPGEDLLDWIGQATSYCMILNRRYQGENPARYFILSNGRRTLLFEWDEGRPLLDLAFEESNDLNPKYIRLKALLAPAATAAPQPERATQHTFLRRSLSEVNADFAWCHQHIYKSDNMSQAAGFTEFVKLIFLKLLSDRSIRDRYGDIVWQDRFDVPAGDVRFSERWIMDREEDARNPMDALQFRQLVSDLEADIAAGRRKRIFEPNAQLRLSAETIKSVVRRLEHTFLFGIDVDLNGRLFETFLSATMRGKDLGQFFTPRSIVKLGTRLGAPQVTAQHMERVLDGCCGTGGFLIDALAEMWGSIEANQTLSAADKRRLKVEVANRALFGVDVGKDPNQARLARMNMYLHGDGGTSIYEADFLDKSVAASDVDGAEVRNQVNQLRRLLQEHPDGYFDLILTNPPFAKEYSRRYEVQSAVLDRYELAVDRPSLKSSIMFFERYRDVLKPGGRLVSVIDDGLLSGSRYAGFRDFLRENFLVRAVISLPGDAFQRSQARVKTSLIILEKRGLGETENAHERLEAEGTQGPVFMYACQYVGIDDPQRQRTLPIDRINRERANEEVAEVVRLYGAFCAGNNSVAQYIVQPERISDRLDVKSCCAVFDRLVPHWHGQGIPTAPLRDLLIPATVPEEDVVHLGREREEITYLVVGYDGFARSGPTVDAADLKPGSLVRVREGQIVVSHINAVHGSICVVPAELDGCVISSEYSAFDAQGTYDPLVLWALVRSSEIRAEFLVRASGVGRTRVDWNTIKEVSVPLPDEEVATSVVDKMGRAKELLALAAAQREEARSLVDMTYGLGSDDAEAILRKFRPPT